MDDIIYEKDYRKVEPDEHDEWYEAVFDRVINGDMLKSFSDAMDKIPKIMYRRIRRITSTFWNAVMSSSSSITGALKGS